MNTVEPIRDKAQIEAMKTELLKRGYRDYMLFVIGLNTGLRVGDILKLKVSDIRGKSHITLHEEKTKKEKRFKINEPLKAELEKYTQDMEPEEFLFKSQKGNFPISTVQAWRILKAAAEKVGLEDIGTHSMRKTFGYFYYQQYNEISYLQKIFNHSSPAVTLGYIGITQDRIDETIDNFSL
ncbi:site-specific integrase [bacterium]|nr:site-specific integrase [bacterium]